MTTDLYILGNVIRKWEHLQLYEKHEPEWKQSVLPPQSQPDLRIANGNPEILVSKTSSFVKERPTARAQAYMGSVEGPRLTDCQELYQINQIRLDGDLNQISSKSVFDLTD